MLCFAFAMIIIIYAALMTVSESLRELFIQHCKA